MRREREEIIEKNKEGTKNMEGKGKKRRKDENERSEGKEIEQ